MIMQSLKSVRQQQNESTVERIGDLDNDADCDREVVAHQEDGLIEHIGYVWLAHSMEW